MKKMVRRFVALALGFITVVVLTIAKRTFESSVERERP